MIGDDDDDPFDTNNRWIMSQHRELFLRGKANLLLVKLEIDPASREKLTGKD